MTNYKIKKILVPFDFTNPTLNALKVADKFALEFNSKIHLLNIIEPALSYEPPGFSSGYYTAIQRYISDSANAIERYIFKTFINPAAYSYKTCFGLCNISIVNEVKNDEYDLIILPDDTNNFVTRMFSTYKPLKIMEQTKIPVIAVNKFYRTVEFRNIILPIRNIINWHEKLPFVISLAKQTGGKIHAVAINENKTGSASEFKCIFDGAVSVLEQENVLGTVKTIDNENCVNELARYSEKQKGDLIAITPTKQNTIIKSLIYPSLYSRFISRSPAPVFGVQLS